MVELWHPGEDLSSKERYLPPEVQFEVSVVKKLHSIWFPEIPYYRVCKECAGTVTWEWYRDRLVFPGEPFQMSFRKDTRASSNMSAMQVFEIDITTWLRKDLEKIKIWNIWGDEPSDVLVFPLLNDKAVLRKVLVPPRTDCLLKYINEECFCMERLENFAREIPMQGFNYLR